MALARVDLESLLRARQLDRTLTTAIPQADPRHEQALAPSGISALDARLGGGFPRGQLSELVGPRSSGRTSLLLQMMAAATGQVGQVGRVGQKKKSLCLLPTRPTRPTRPICPPRPIRP